MNILQELGLKYGTDKSKHKYKGLSYLDIYHSHFQNYRQSVKSFVEIGVLNGSSLKMWRDYFPNATIHGVDINPRCKDFESDRIKVHIGNQSDEQFLDYLRNSLGPTDILIDDGSHITHHQIKTYEFLIPIMKANSFYVIEDLKNSYEEVLNHHNLREIWPGMSYNNPSDSLKNYRDDFNVWIQSKIKQMDFHCSDSKVFGIYHYPMIVILENKESQ